MSTEITEQDFEEAHDFFTVAGFISLFQADPRGTVQELVDIYPEEAAKLRVLLNRESPGPIARLLQRYHDSGE